MAKDKQEATCPNCGYCPCCGRSNRQDFASPRPLSPPYTPPWYPGWRSIRPPTPWGPFTVTSTTISNAPRGIYTAYNGDHDEPTAEERRALAAPFLDQPRKRYA